MSNIIVGTDPHFKDKNPLNRIDNYVESLLEKIGKIRLITEKKKSSAFILAGDVFDVKNSEKVSHGLVTNLMAEFKKFPCPVYSIVGNHDIKYDRLDTLPEQPLGVLFESGTLKRLSSLIIDDTEIVGVDFTPPDKTSIDSFIFNKTTAKQILITHHNLFPGVTKFFDEAAISYEQLANKVNASIIVNGHIHYPPDGKYIISIAGKYFVNPGSLSRGSLTRDNVERDVQVVYIDLKKMEPELVNLKAKPASEVFDILRREAQVEKDKQIEDFVEKLRVTVAESEGADATTIIQSLDIDSAVRAKVEYFLSIASD